MGGDAQSCALAHSAEGTCPSHPAMVEGHEKQIYSWDARASVFGKMNPMITGYAIAESSSESSAISKRIRSLPALSLLPRFGRGPAPAGRRNRLPHPLRISPWKCRKSRCRDSSRHLLCSLTQCASHARGTCVEKSLDAARRSACATSATTSAPRAVRRHNPQQSAKSVC